MSQRVFLVASAHLHAADDGGVDGERVVKDRDVGALAGGEAAALGVNAEVFRRRLRDGLDDLLDGGAGICLEALDAVIERRDARGDRAVGERRALAADGDFVAAYRRAVKDFLG